MADALIPDRLAWLAARVYVITGSGQRIGESGLRRLPGRASQNGASMARDPACLSVVLASALGGQV